MGMTASYMEATGLFIEALKVKSAAGTNELFKRLYTDKTLEVCHLDKMWDGLHYFLTGVSVYDMIANHPMENSLLSEAVVGSDGRDEGISWIYPERVKEIADALAPVDGEEKWTEFSMEEFEESEIYMMGQADVLEEELRQEMLDTFGGFKEFFSNVADRGNGVVIMIG